MFNSNTIPQVLTPPPQSKNGYVNNYKFSFNIYLRQSVSEEKTKAAEAAKNAALDPTRGITSEVIDQRRKVTDNGDLRRINNEHHDHRRLRDADNFFHKSRYSKF